MGVPRKTEGTVKRIWQILALLLVCGVSAYYAFNRPGFSAKASRNAPARGAQQPVPVVALPARVSDVGVYLTGLGTVVPLNTVTVKSRVDGQLMEVRYREGQTVRKGDLLAVIDPRPFQVQLTQAEGQMIRDREQLNNARLDLERYRVLLKQDSIPRQQYDAQEALVRQLEGAVKVDQGLIDNARLQLTYSRITAPVGGRVGLRQVDPGNMIHATDPNGLVVITQIQPISVIFPIPEDNLPKLLGRMKAAPGLSVEAYDREQKERLATGTLVTLDNQIDPGTGTVKLKAVFPNAGDELFPNQFVNARLLLETMHDVVVVPAAALQRGSQGTFVYLVGADMRVQVRPVTPGPPRNDDIAITAGLRPGELVVVDGAERLRDGSQVVIREPGDTRQTGNGRGSQEGRRPPPGGRAAGDKPQRPAR
jgi:multidrug efflux system membrane fusion protein